MKSKTSKKIRLSLKLIKRKKKNNKENNFNEMKESFTAFSNKYILGNVLGKGSFGIVY